MLLPTPDIWSDFLHQVRLPSHFVVLSLLQRKRQARVPLLSPNLSPHLPSYNYLSQMNATLAAGATEFPPAVVDSFETFILNGTYETVGGWLAG